MAFRKRLSITKGMHLNFSGNGVGIGLRLFPGLSISANRNGLYCNQSIPGTGFYSRNKIGGWNSATDEEQEEPQDRLQEVGIDEPQEAGKTYFEFIGNITEDNEPEVIIKRDGRPITDLELSVLKKYDGYNDSVLNVHKKIVQRVKDETDEVVDIYKLTAKPISEEELNAQLNELSVAAVDAQYFDIPEPKIDAVRSRLTHRAELEINSILFWTNNAKRKEYVESRLDAEYRKEMSIWTASREKFEAQEAERFKSETIKAQQDFEAKKNALEGAISGNTDYVNGQIEALLKSVQMPVEFSVDYEYDEAKGLLMIQLDLPEIEDFPARKASLLASGKASVKAKTKYELNNDYATGVCGLSFFFAGMLFNISTHIQFIVVNGFTQRINGATGLVEDQYVYSVLFNRFQFSKVNFEAINPIMALEAYPHRLDLLKTAEMKSIQPFGQNEVCQLIQSSNI